MWPWKLQLTFTIWRPYVTSWSKRSFSRCGLLKHILCECWLMRHYFQWVWVTLSEWGIILGGWECVGMYVALFLVGGDEWGWVEHYFGWVGMGGKIFLVDGSDWGWVHCLIMPSRNIFHVHRCVLIFLRVSTVALKLITLLSWWHLQNQFGVGFWANTVIAILLLQIL